jgi:hypothetical protein
MLLAAGRRPHAHGAPLGAAAKRTANLAGNSRLNYIKQLPRQRNHESIAFGGPSEDPGAPKMRATGMQKGYPEAQSFRVPNRLRGPVPKMNCCRLSRRRKPHRRLWRQPPDRPGGGTCYLKNRVGSLEPRGASGETCCNASLGTIGGPEVKAERDSPPLAEHFSARRCNRFLRVGRNDYDLAVRFCQARRMMPAKPDCSWLAGAAGGAIDISRLISPRLTQSWLRAAFSMPSGRFK